MPPPALEHDWNRPQPDAPPSRRLIELQDETLRDGLQCPSVSDPPIEAKLAILHLMEGLGIHGADLGLPGAGPRAISDVERLVQEIVDQRLALKPSCAGRTLKVDIDPIAEIAERTGKVLEADLFIGSSPIRQYAEGWDLDRLLRTTEEAVRHAVDRGLEVMFVTEDTVRSHPEDLRRLYTVAIEAGARRICLCDTVGHATPQGVKALVRFMRGVVRETGEPVAIDWHGHRDRGLSVANTLAAMEAGVDRIHGTALGIGERVGNTPMELLLLNLDLMGALEADLTLLEAYTRTVAEACRVPLPVDWPAVGAAAFGWRANAQAQAIQRALEGGQARQAEALVSAVPASRLGRDLALQGHPAEGPAVEGGEAQP